MQNISTKNQDKEDIDRLVRSFFDLFDNARGNTPQWEKINDLCIPQIRIIKKTALAEEIYDLQNFIEPRKKLLADGNLTEFEEQEIQEETKISGSIAQRASRYRKSGNLNGIYFKGEGNKFFQFVKMSQGWKITSLSWEDDSI